MQSMSTPTTTPQEPLGSGFGATTTAQEALAGRDLTGRLALVTGGYSGLGRETTRVLAEAGATVIVPARTPQKAAAALEGLPRVEQDALDLQDPASIDAFADRVLDSGRPLDILITSAGIMAVPLSRDARGNESQLSTNHLGHFRLTARLWPALRRAQGARVISVSSRGHRIAAVDFDDPNFERRAYDKWVAYGQSKSANALFAVALDARGQADGVRAFSVHPGTILTDLARHLSDDELRAMGALDDEGRPITANLKTIEQGAATAIWCATSSDLDGRGGVYCEDVDVAAVVPPDSASGEGVRPWAIDPELAERLWALSVDLEGADLP
jgi:NAD(P)-dependent dehydrogenase (short-subunit alcohol dehydrogenase family)